MVFRTNLIRAKRSIVSQVIPVPLCCKETWCVLKYHSSSFLKHQNFIKVEKYFSGLLDEIRCDTTAWSVGKICYNLKVVEVFQLNLFNNNYISRRDTREEIKIQEFYKNKNRFFWLLADTLRQLEPLLHIAYFHLFWW